jgi:chorismate mutase
MVRALRGATTVESNEAEQIIGETGVLLQKIVEENKLDAEDIISVIFSVTEDLDAAFPAVAARRLGWTSIALMCTREIDVPESLKKCIRVMMHINTEKKNSELKHIFLKEARSLRPDLSD